MELIAQYGHIWLVVLPLVFLGAVVDSIAGGGGLISLPAYMMVLPPHIAAATNKFAASFGTLTSLVRFLKSGKVHLKVSLIAALGALIGAPIGAQIQLFLPEAWLNWILLALLPCVASGKVHLKVSLIAALGALIGAPIGAQIQLFLPEAWLNWILLALLPCVAFFLMIRRDFGTDDGQTDFTCTVQAALQAFGIGLLIGGYDGLIGPGTGTFLILAFCSVMKFPLLLASGSAKVVNFASNISALVVYLLHGQVLFAVGIPALLSAIVGYQVGAHMALRGGAKVVRGLIFVVLGILLLKTGYTVLMPAA